MSTPECLLLDAARWNGRIPPAHEIEIYAASEGVDPGPLFRAAPDPGTGGTGHGPPPARSRPGAPSGSPGAAGAPRILAGSLPP